MTGRKLFGTLFVHARISIVINDEDIARKHYTTASKSQVSLF